MSLPAKNNTVPVVREAVGSGKLRSTFGNNIWLYLLIVPGLIYLIIFQYIPIAGNVISFENFSTFLGVFHSSWVGLTNFQHVFHDPYMLTLLKNTFILAFLSMIIGFPIPILFALFLAEVSNKLIRMTVQTFTLIPYFISPSAMVSILYKILSPEGGLVNRVLNAFGIPSVFFLTDPGWFRPIFIMLSTWQMLGYSSLIYLAAITAVDPQLYESAELDGATRMQKMFKITLPSIRHMVIIMFIMNMGTILTVDVQKVLLLYNPSVYPTADVIQTYVYRLAFAGTGFPEYSYAAAVNVLLSILALLLLWVTNQVSKRVSESRLF